MGVAEIMLWAHVLLLVSVLPLYVAVLSSNEVRREREHAQGHAQDGGSFVSSGQGHTVVLSHSFCDDAVNTNDPVCVCVCAPPCLFPPL
jgi:hypothetical protein